MRRKALRVDDEAPARLPETGFVRLSTVLALIPVSARAWWAGVAAGRFPTPVKLGPNTTAWRAEDIKRLIEEPEAWATPQRRPRLVRG
jgi:predicted DNA-binding transcriptional regulator AlpA